MKKLAFIGNCQLQQIGWLLKHFFQQHQLEFEVIWYEPIFALGNLQAPIVPLFDALERADHLFGQYHEPRWGSFSTQNLKRLFDIKVVPTLESMGSFPQLNPFSKELNYNLYTVDYRFLQLYLQGVDVGRAAQEYQAIELNEGRLLRQCESESKKYRYHFEQGNLVFDYSNVFYAAVVENRACYHTHNHPNNQHIQWLANQILQAVGSPVLIDFSKMPEILYDSAVPSLGGAPSTAYRVRSVDTGLMNAAKIYYTLFDSYDKKFLDGEYVASNYVNYLS